MIHFSNRKPFIVFVCGDLCPTHIVLCVCLVCLRLVYPMLPVSLDYSFRLPLRYILTRLFKPKVKKESLASIYSLVNVLRTIEC